MSDYPMLISNKLHSFRNFYGAKILYFGELSTPFVGIIKKEVLVHLLSYSLFVAVFIR